MQVLEIAFNLSKILLAIYWLVSAYQVYFKGYIPDKTSISLGFLGAGLYL